MNTELVLLILLLAVIAYWLNAIRCKEIAREAGKNACDKYHVHFLDDTVVMKKIRLLRNPQGRLSFYREYDFEFTSDGDVRHTACLTMLAGKIQTIDMGVYRNTDIN
ncbi:MAG: DUF3301 domain-containing protein [Thioalkalispiraceae bacterium]|jgi:hypothetical protein